MKVLLIKSERLTETDRWVASPVGILYLAAAARRAGHDVDIFDARIARTEDVKPRLDALLAEKPDVIGLSAHSHQAKNTRMIGRYVRNHSDAFIVAGGPLATVNTDYTLHNAPVSACVRGEGERTFTALLESLNTGSDWRRLPGLAYKAGDEIHITEDAEPIDPLDELPQPAWDLIDFGAYAKCLSVSLRLGRRASIHTSRGCPYSCIYCQHYFGKKFRARSPKHVLEEIDMLYHRYGIRFLEIIDDVFNMDYARAVKILEAIRDDYPGMKISFPNAVRGDLLDEPFVKLLKQARCVFIPVSMESGSARIQGMIRKNLDMEKITKAAGYLNRYGIPAFTCFMVGFPTETREEMEQTFGLARRLDGLVPFFSMVTPYPGTKLWDITHPGETVNPETLDGGYGYRFDDDEAAQFMEEAINIARKKFMHPRYWFVYYSEIRWRLSSRWRILLLKLLSVVAPLKWRRKLIKKINRSFELCLE